MSGAKKLWVVTRVELVSNWKQVDFTAVTALVLLFDGVHNRRGALVKRQLFVDANVHAHQLDLVVIVGAQENWSDAHYVFDCAFNITVAVGGGGRRCDSRRFKCFQQVVALEVRDRLFEKLVLRRNLFDTAVNQASAMLEKREGREELVWLLRKG